MDELVPFRPRSVARPGDLEHLSRRWLQRLQRRGRADSTLRAYAVDLGQFVGYCQQRGLMTITAISPRHVEDWLDALLAGEGMSPRSASRKLETVRGLCRYAVQQQLLEYHATPVTGVEAPTWHADPVIAPPASAIERVIESTPTDSPQGLRDRAMLMLLYDSALRASGVACLDIYKVSPSNRCVVQPDGLISYEAKGGRLETTVAGEATLQAVADWMAVRRHFARSNRPTEALLLSNRGTRITRQTVYQRVRALGKAAGVPGLHPHMLRHRRLGDLYGHLDPRAAADVAGHKDVKTTMQTYGGTARQKLRERVQRECPVGVEQQRRVS